MTTSTTAIHRDARDWLAMIGRVAESAGTDPQSCVALAELVRATARELEVSETLEESVV